MGASRQPVHHRFRGHRGLAGRRTSAGTVAELLRSSWRAVTGIITRVVDQARGRTDRLAGLTRIGIDEVSYRKGHRYLLIVTCHTTGRVVWARPGRNQDTVRAVFDDLGPQRAAQLTHVSCDGAEWIHDIITERATQGARNPLWPWRLRSMNHVATAGRGWASSQTPQPHPRTRSSPHPFITANVEPGTTVITDGRQGYSGIERLGHTRDRRSQRAARARREDPGTLLPAVHRVASLAKRWLLGTHHGPVDEAHLQSYLDEFTLEPGRKMYGTFDADGLNAGNTPLQAGIGRRIYTPRGVPRSG